MKSFKILQPFNAQVKRGVRSSVLSSRNSARHWDLKVSRAKAKIYENFANNFSRNKANNKCFIFYKMHM